MRLHLFILLLLTSLCFGVDFNAKTEENRAKIMELYSNYKTRSINLEKYNNNLWFEDEEFLRELLDKVYEHNLDDLLRNIKNKNILNDKELFTKIVKQASYYFSFADDTLRSDRKYVLKLIQAGYNIYSNIDNKFYADKEITLLSVKQQGCNLEYADKKLKNDKEVVLEAVQNSREALAYASNELRDDKEVVLEAMKNNLRSLNYASKRIKNDKKFILKSVRKDGWVLKYASKKLKDDKKIVWEAIQNDGFAFRYASSRFKNDKKFVLETLKTRTDSLAYANKDMLKDRDVILYFFKMLDKENASRYHEILMKIDPSLLDDEEIMLEAVGKNGIFLQYASKRLRKNKTIVLKAVSENGLAFKYADKTLRENQEIVALALRSNPKAKYYINNEKNKIKRKVKPLAWETYNIDDTLELLYGKDRVYEKSDEIDIKLPTNIMEYFDTSGSGSLILNTNKKVKSIAILQDKEADRALVALYYPYGNTVNIRLPLKIFNASLTMMIEGLKVVVITETENNHLFINEYTIKYDYVCMNGYGMRDYLDDLKKDLNRTRFKTKYQIDENGVRYLKFQIFNTMLNYDEAEKLNTKVNFISHIEGHSKDKKLFDLYTSEYISKDPFIKIEVKNMKQDEGIELSYTTIDGKVKSKYVKPRKMKKKSH